LGDAVTDAEGHATLGAFPENHRVVLMAEATGRAGVRWSARHGRDSRAAWPVTLRRVAPLRGRVVSTDGSAVAGARVEQGRPPFAVAGDESAGWHHPPASILD